MRWSTHRWILAGGALWLAAGSVAAAEPRIPAIASRDFAGVALGVPMGTGLRLENVQVAETGEAAAFVLERFRVFAPEAQITVHGARGKVQVLPAPANAYF